MRLYVRGMNFDTAPYMLYPHPLNDAVEPKFELVCQTCTTDPQEPVTVWIGAIAQMGVLVGAILRHETANAERHSHSESR